MGMWGRKDQDEERPAAGATPPSSSEPTSRPATTAPPAQRPSSSEASSQRAVIGPSIQVKGELIGREDLVVQGYVEGVIRLKEHHLTVGETADLHATLEAKAIRIEGKVDGDVIAGERVELASGSTVLGDIKSPRISIADGARFKGSVDMEQPDSGAPASRAAEPEQRSTSKTPQADKPAAGKGADPAKNASGKGEGTSAQSSKGAGSS